VKLKRSKQFAQVLTNFPKFFVCSRLPIPNREGSSQHFLKMFSAHCTSKCQVFEPGEENDVVDDQWIERFSSIKVIRTDVHRGDSLQTANIQ